MNKWIVDNAEDANGFYTLRLADGSEHGNTDEQPIATVYESHHAKQIVREHNAHEALVAAVMKCEVFRRACLDNDICIPSSVDPTDEIKAALSLAGME